MRKIASKYKNYGYNSIFLFKIFFNYIIIIIKLFNTTIFSLYQTLYYFYFKIINLSIIYK